MIDCLIITTNEKLIESDLDQWVGQCGWKRLILTKANREVITEGEPLIHVSPV